MKTIAFIFLGIIFFMLSGCATSTLYPGYKGMVETILPDYSKYVQNDNDLSYIQKQRRLNTIENYKTTLKHYQKENGKK